MCHFPCFAFRYEGSRFRLEVIYKGEEYDPFLIMNEDGEKAKETRKAKEWKSEPNRHAESDEEYEFEVIDFAR